MSDDLTRWNRAGLSRFEYVDGNAATYLELLRQALAERFPDRWDALRTGLPEDLDQEPPGDRLERLLTQYHRERGDWGWEIARALARVCHGVTGHLDVYANEGYLSTATQWDNVRRLVEMLDYSPAPPASATARLVLHTQGEGGTVEQGFQVQHAPPEGGAPVIFETLEDLEVEPDLDALRPAGWNRSPRTFQDTGAAGPFSHYPSRPWRGPAAAPFPTSPWIAPEKSTISAVDLGLVVREPGIAEAVVVTVDRVDPLTRAIGLTDVPFQQPWRHWTRGETSLRVKPGFLRRPRLNGPDVVSFEKPQDLNPGEVVAWKEDGAWTFGRVEESDEWAVRLTDGSGPNFGTAVYRTFAIERGDTDLLFPADYEVAARESDGDFLPLPDGDSEVVRGTDANGNTLEGAAHRRLKDTGGLGSVLEIYLVPAGASPVGRVTAVPSGELTFDGKPGKLGSGQWVVADDGTALWPVKIQRITEREDHFTIAFEPSAVGHRARDRTGSGLPDQLVRLHGLFEHTLRPTGWNRNHTPLTGDRVVLDLEELGGGQMPRLLARGRKVILEREVLPTDEDDDITYAGAIETSVQEVEELDEQTGRVVLVLASPLVEEDGFTLGNAVLRGNVVSAGHGERKPEKVLGSGDAARSNQRFVLAEEGVSFVADATQPSGVRADITVRVEDRGWQQVANLRDAGPADAHYAVRMTEDGYLAVDFGDGRHGRRLPTGGNNVRIGFRLGTGLSGNLPAGSLVKAARPHRLVKSVRQPLRATGGNDMEDVRSLKENAPASVLTLERAVSVGDLSHLAARQSSVWQARAFSVPAGLSRRESVMVVVVPAGGGKLGALEEGLRKTLQAHTLPGVDVLIAPARTIPFDVHVTVRVKSAELDPEEVVDGVRHALLDSFSLERRRLGQDLFLSEVYQVVEDSQGVESSVCTLDGDSALRRLKASDDQVFHLHREDSRIDLRHEEWSL